MTGQEQEERDRQLFDQIARKYARKDILPASSWARRNQLYFALESLLAKQKSLGTVVDIGCGVGAPSLYLQGLYDTYYGIDQSAEMIESAKQLYGKNEQAVFLADNIKDANVPDHSADVILSIGALHHMTEMDEVFHSLKRYAKSGTVFVAIEPQRANPLIQLLRAIRGRMDGDYSEEQHFFSKAELATLFQRHGLQNVELRYHYYLTPPFAQVVFQPQAIFEPLSRLAVHGDRWLGGKMPAFLQPLSFNLIAIGQFT